jgi:hypothetical protein
MQTTSARIILAIIRAALVPGVKKGHECYTKAMKLTHLCRSYALHYVFCQHLVIDGTYKTQTHDNNNC